MLTVQSSCNTIMGKSIELFCGENHKNVLAIGVFHGDEPQGDFLLRKYMQHNKNSSLIFIPCLNPDGLNLKRRTNSNGVDINRNFPTKNWRISERNEFYSGISPASEIETRFVIDAVEKYKPNLILTLHSPFKVVNYDGDAFEISQKISNIISYPVEDNIGYETPGSFGTWAGKERHIPTITLELDENIDVNLLIKPVFDILVMLENY